MIHKLNIDGFRRMIINDLRSASAAHNHDHTISYDINTLISDILDIDISEQAINTAEADACALLVALDHSKTR